MRRARTTSFTSRAGLFGAVLVLQASAIAQPIKIPDFRERPTVAQEIPSGPCDDCGVIRSIREIHKRQDAPGYKAGSSSALSAFDKRAVGALIVLPFGPGNTDKASYVGGAGTPE